MGVPDSILLKAGPLTAEETVLMRSHCQRGFDILARVTALVEAAEIVLSHQECYNGTGYPRGLKGEEIPLGARIFAVADTLDAMTSDRPYRQATSFTNALQEVQRFRGTQFDPNVVDVFSRFPKTPGSSCATASARRSFSLSSFGWEKTLSAMN